MLLKFVTFGGGGKQFNHLQSSLGQSEEQTGTRCPSKCETSKYSEFLILISSLKSTHISTNFHDEMTIVCPPSAKQPAKFMHMKF